MEQKKSWIKFPKVGMRTVKTVISATLIAIIYGLINDYTPLTVNPCFACIGAVFGMGNVWKGGLQSGGNRFIGTLIGGIATKFNDYAFLGENGTCNGKLQMVAIILFALVATCFAIITYFTRDKSKKVKVEGEDVPVAKD